MATMRRKLREGHVWSSLPVVASAHTGCAAFGRKPLEQGVFRPWEAWNFWNGSGVGVRPLYADTGNQKNYEILTGL